MGGGKGERRRQILGSPETGTKRPFLAICPTGSSSVLYFLKASPYGLLKPSVGLLSEWFLK